MQKLIYPNLKQGLVGAWCPSIDRSRSTLLVDQSGYGNHGTLTSMDPATDWVASAGKIALDFDGSNDYVSVSGLTNFSGSTTTVAFWILTRSYDTFGAVIFGTNTGSSVYWQLVQNDSQVFISGQALTLASVIPFADSTWRHVGMVARPSGLECYVNGRLAGFNFSAPTAVAAGTKSFAIGDWIGGLAGNFTHNGLLDDIRAYNRALTPSELATLAQRRGIAYETYRVPIVRGAAVGGPNAGSGSVTGIGTLTGAGSVVRSGSGSIDSVGLITGVGLKVSSGSGSIDSVGLLTGAGQSTRNGSGSVDGIGLLTGVGQAPILGPASGFGSVIGVGLLNGAGSTVRSGSGSLDAIGVLTGVGFAPIVGGATGFGTVSGIGLLSGAGTTTRRGFGSITAIDSIIGSGSVVRSGSGSIDSVGRLTGAGPSSTSSSSMYYYLYLAQ